MSIKVYRAYRLKKKRDFWPLVRDIQKIGTLKVKSALEALFLEFMEAVDTSSEKYLDLRKTMSDKMARARVVESFMCERYKEASVSSCRDFFDFDVSVTFREHRGRIYLIPYCDMRLSNVLDFLDEDPRLEDYHYQNQTDKPPEVSAREWDARSKVWNYLTEDDIWQQFLTLELCSYKMWWKMSPYIDLMYSGKLRDDVPKPPSMAKLIQQAASSSASEKDD